MSEFTTGPDPAAQPPDHLHAEFRPRLTQPPKGRRLTKKPDPPPAPLTPEQSLLILDARLATGCRAPGGAGLPETKQADWNNPVGLLHSGRIVYILDLGHGRLSDPPPAGARSAARNPSRWGCPRPRRGPRSGR